MYFGMKNTLKSNHNYSLKQVQNKKKKKKKKRELLGCLVMCNGGEIIMGWKWF
jgi:hypothetical protein